MAGGTETDPLKPPSRFGADAEKRIAKLTGSRRQPGSGAKWFAKSDLKNATTVTEVKATTKKSYVLSLKTLLKIEEEALAQDRDPSFVLEFTTATGRIMYKIERFYGV